MRPPVLAAGQACPLRAGRSGRRNKKVEHSEHCRRPRKSRCPLAAFIARATAGSSFFPRLRAIGGGLERQYASYILGIGRVKPTGALAAKILASWRAISSGRSAGATPAAGDQRSCTRGPGVHQAGSRRIGPIETPLHASRVVGGTQSYKPAHHHLVRAQMARCACIHSRLVSDVPEV